MVALLTANTQKKQVIIPTRNTLKQAENNTKNLLQHTRTFYYLPFKTFIMYIYKLYIDFSRYSDNDFLALVIRVIMALTGNPKFPTTNPTLAHITALKDDYAAAISAAVDGGKAAHTHRDNVRDLLENDMRILAKDLEITANNDKEALESTGLGVHGGPKADQTEPVTPEKMKLEYGRLSGTVDASVEPVANADVYEFRYTLDEYGPTAKWVYPPASTKSKITITDIPLGSNMWAQVRCINSKGISNWSDPAHLTFIH